jgi:hypothetical protein
MKKNTCMLFTIIIALIVLSSCATKSGSISSTPGFLHGLFHGFIMLFSFIGSLFTDYTIYAFPNSGVWYNLGFVLGAMMFFGGGTRGACRKKRD